MPQLFSRCCSQGSTRYFSFCLKTKRPEPRHHRMARLVCSWPSCPQRFFQPSNGFRLLNWRVYPYAGWVLRILSVGGSRFRIRYCHKSRLRRLRISFPCSFPGSQPIWICTSEPSGSFSHLSAFFLPETRTLTFLALSFLFTCS